MSDITEDELRRRARIVQEVRGALWDTLGECADRHPTAPLSTTITGFVMAFDDFRRTLPMENATLLEEMLKQRLVVAQH